MGSVLPPSSIPAPSVSDFSQGGFNPVSGHFAPPSETFAPLPPTGQGFGFSPLPSAPSASASALPPHPGSLGSPATAAEASSAMAAAMAGSAPAPAPAPAPQVDAASNPAIADLENAIKNLITGLKSRFQHVCLFSFFHSFSFVQNTLGDSLSACLHGKQDKKTASTLDTIKISDLKNKLSKDCPEALAPVSDYVRSLLEFNIAAAESAFHKLQARDIQGKLTASLVLNLKILLTTIKKVRA